MVVNLYKYYYWETSVKLFEAKDNMEQIATCMMTMTFIAVDNWCKKN
jgi:hypothetical protein